ncbi:PREDICTED: LOW QUALITY PROTEIN: histone H1-like [Branchiostoma belcheri]|uniref:LOW QUALITY PROTEIN: histone H1-like n=1 Tax=Branchiostoma belcheri TaxID=7741 RepID=A0A6P4YZV6_BRABE|nr:PREDICTED: LOW QUALITY PROTEIN: histone H1-like [Branchiostoma belcheri]
MSGSFARLTQTKPVDMSTAASSPKKASKPKAPAAHPPTTAMITAAVEALKDRTGSSVPAIKKYIAANYKFDVEKKAHFIKRALKALVEKGTLLQVKGTGASGSFKINVAAKKAEEKAAKKAAKKPAKKPAAKKATKPKATKPKKPKAKKAATPKKTKKPAAKKTKKSPAKKPAAKKPTKKTPAKKTVKKAAPAKKASKPNEEVKTRPSNFLQTPALFRATHILTKELCLTPSSYQFSTQIHTIPPPAKKERNDTKLLIKEGKS